ncbi:MAG: porin family protein [Saprospiraceae bacterium]|nr:porin family protein [Saprospiraceae bacterium]
MKKLICVVVVICYSTIFALGQFEDYWGIAGGNFNGTFRNDAINTNTDIGFNLFLGKFLSQETLIGAGLSLGTNTLQNIKNPRDRSSTSSTGLSAFLRYYFNDSDRFLTYIEPSIEVRKIYTTDENVGLSSTGDRIDYFRGSIGGGFNYFVNKNIALNVQANMSLVERVATKDSIFADGTKTQFNIGLQFFASNYNPNKSYSKKKQPISVLQAESWIFGGSVRSENSIIQDKTLFITPSVGYFTAKNFVFGLAFEGAYLRETKSNQFAIIPFMRYHFPLRSSYFFLEGGLGFAQTKTKLLDGAVPPFETTSDLFGEGKVGIGIFLSKYTAMHGGIRYRYLVPFTDEIDFTTAFNEIGVEIGVQYFFENKNRDAMLPE